MNYVKSALGLLAALIVGWSFTAAGWAASEIRFGVVREAPTENDPQWLQVKGALRGVSYKVVPLSEVGGSLLQGVSVLFLPNVSVISPEEATALGDWVEHGGKLVVSGQLAQGSSPQVQQQLQQLTGGVWLTSLEGENLLTLNSKSAPWQRSDRTSGVQGAGTLSSNSLDIVAQWDQPDKPAAVLSGERVTYLGWQWGRANSTTFDRSWLTAALEKYLPGTAAPVIKIEPVETLAMRQELTNLLGRVENIAATSQDARQLPSGYPQAVEQARQALISLPKLISQGEDTQARVLWQGAIEELWRNYPNVQTASPPEVRAIWLDRGTIVQAGSPDGLRQIFDRLADAGINTVFFETLNAGYPIYPSRVAVEQNPLTVGWDPLAAAVSLAHERKMELHAWCWTFAVGNSRHNRLLNLPDTYPGPVLSRHPEWGMSDNQGSFRPRGQNEYWIDPANPEARAYLMRIYDEILKSYNVDGLQLDYIRYPFQGSYSFGFSQISRSGFRAINGVDPLVLSPSRDLSLNKLWNQYKARQVSEFVAQTAMLVRDIRPRVLLSAAVYPFVNRERITKIQQDWESWARQGQVDLLVPMTYKLNARALQQEVEPILNPVEELPALFLPSVNLQELLQVQLRDQIQAVRDLPSGGYSLFAAAHLTNELDQVLHQAASVSSAIPYREPLRTVRERFDILVEEWNYLIDHNSVAGSTESLKAWRVRTTKLQQFIKDVAEKPTVTKVRQARTEITAFRAALQDYLRLDRSEHSYRNQTWDNRLAGMDSLLRYAELVFSRVIAKR
ncbi:family 10 glycosylhydrolase [Anthocerotibacter panamensis]|uniref:family 10 glycosylhydrolase n=1 Tax=Anthocerotibacter panamensis TaxID=2857077 RepID=UPI001C408A26|nr:family 10 glycosylhydrolase [Anthocerotibacter panamensis]